MKISIMAALLLSLTFAQAQERPVKKAARPAAAAKEAPYEGRRQNVEEEDEEDKAAASKRKYRYGSEELEVDPD